MANSNPPLTFDSKYLAYKGIHLSTIQSVVVITTALMYYCKGNIQFSDINFQVGLLFLLAAGISTLYAYLLREKKVKLKAWHFLVIVSVVALVFNYEATVHAQILDDIDGALGDVGTAAGGSFAADVLEAVIDLIRIAVYMAIAGAVIAGIIFGVTQGQWQAPLLVVGVIISIGMFLEIMGAVVFG